jgi:hypothetical protein
MGAGIRKPMPGGRSTGQVRGKRIFGETWYSQTVPEMGLVMAEAIGMSTGGRKVEP